MFFAETMDEQKVRKHLDKHCILNHSEQEILQIHLSGPTVYLLNHFFTPRLGHYVLRSCFRPSDPVTVKQVK